MPNTKLIKDIGVQGRYIYDRYVGFENPMKHLEMDGACIDDLITSCTFQSEFFNCWLDNIMVDNIKVELYSINRLFPKRHNYKALLTLIFAVVHISSNVALIF